MTDRPDKRDRDADDDRASDENRDPITGAHGAHPVATGLGAAADGMGAGAMAGTVVGPVGTLLGAAAGAIAGGLTGKRVAEIIDPTIEEAYWWTSYSSRPYVTRDATFDDYGPAYRYGVSSYARYPGRTFGQAEAELRRDWERDRGSSRLTWNEARHAVRDSWSRISDAVERAVAGHSDRDGK